MWKFNSFPAYLQMDSMDCGPTCVKIISQHFGKNINLEHLRDLCPSDRTGVSLKDLTTTFKKLNIEAIAIEANLDELIHEIPLPAIAHWEGNHFLVVYKTSKKKIFVSDPEIGLTSYTHDQFVQKWAENKQGLLVLAEPSTSFLNHEIPEPPKRGFGFLFGYLFPYRRYLWQLFLGLFLAACIQLTLPFLTQNIVDLGINYDNLSLIRLIVIAQVFLFVFLLVSEIIREWLLMQLSFRINLTMISDFLDKMIDLPLASFERKSIGDFLQRIYDHLHIDDFIGGRMLSIPFDVLTLFMFSIVLGYFDSTVLLIFSIGTVLLMGWSLLFLKHKAKLDHQLFKLNKHERSNLIQLITAIKEIKLNGSEQRRKLEWKRLQILLYRMEARLLRIDLFQLKGGVFLKSLTGILIIFWSAKAVMAGDMTLGSMLAIQFIIGSLSLPIQNILDFLAGLEKSALALDRLAEVHDNEQEVGFYHDLRPPDMGDIKMDDLSFAYGSESNHDVLRNISLTIPKGKVTAIVGASGSGKTTLLHLLLKLYAPREGTIHIGTQNLRFISAEKWRRQCACVLQGGSLFNDTIERNITESRSNEPLDMNRLIKSVEMANLSRFIDGLHQGFKTRIGENGHKLSGGEKQRVLLARAIYKNPDYLFFDEATSALDSANEKQINENLMKFFKNRTVVLIAHRLSTVRNADQIIMLDNGQVTEIGTHEGLIADKGAYYELIINQL